MFRERGPLATNVTYNSFFNLPGRQHQPYVSWKGDKKTNQSTISAVAINSRPKPASGPGFGKANPIKHWRKQLMPAQGNPGPITGRVSVSQVMDRPGGSVYLAKANENHPPTCATEPLKTQLITNYLYDYNVNKDCTTNCQTDTLGNKIPIYNPQRITRPGTTILDKKYYTTSTAYLRSRVKLYNQNQTIAPIKGIDYFLPSDNGPKTFVHPSDDLKDGTQNFHSVYCTDASCSKAMVRVIYKPSNFGYSQQSAVSSSLRIANLQKQAITKSAASLKENFGTYSANNSRYRGITGAPFITKSIYQKSSDSCPNFQIRNTPNSGRQPSGGSGIRAVCSHMASDKIEPSVSGTITSRSRAPGTWAKGPVLPQKSECQLILEALAEARALQNDNITYYDEFEMNPLNFPYDPTAHNPPLTEPTGGTIPSASHN